MADERAHDQGRRLAEDLRRLREERDVSVEALHEETKIPLGLIESFEQDALFGHDMFNKVYLRSFARTYAQVVGLDVDRVARALEAAMDGDYGGELRGEPSADAAPPADEPTTDAEPTTDDVSAASEAETGPAEAPPERAEEPTPEAESSVAADDGDGDGQAEPVTSPPRAQRPSETERTSGGSGKRASRGTSVAPWLLGVGGLVVAGLLVWLLLSLFTGDDGAESEAEAAPPDTAVTAAPASEPTPEIEPVEIGDSLDVEVVAADGPVVELRVRPDEATRRPYWIEEGQSQTFRAADRIVFSPPIEATAERPLDMMRLRVEGRDYPTDRRNAEGQIVITRDRAQTLLDSLARAGS